MPDFRAFRLGFPRRDSRHAENADARIKGGHEQLRLLKLVTNSVEAGLVGAYEHRNLSEELGAGAPSEPSAAEAREARKAEMFPGSSENNTTTRKLEEHAVNLRKKDRNEIIQGRRKLQKTESVPQPRQGLGSRICPWSIGHLLLFITICMSAAAIRS